MNILQQATTLATRRSTGILSYPLAIAASKLQQSDPSSSFCPYPPHYCQQQRCFFEILIDPRAISQQKKNKKQKKSWKPSYRFVDRTRVRVSGGSGGKGNLSLHQQRRRHRLRPDGGHGGNGGSVIIVADPTEQTLRWTHPHVQAENGTNGSSQEKYGRNGKNLILRVPCGVVIKRILNHNEEWDEVEKRVVSTAQACFDGDMDMSSEKDLLEEDEDVSEEIEMLNKGLEIDVFPEDSVQSQIEYDTIDSRSEDRESVVLADLNEAGNHVMVARGGRGGFGTCLYASRHGPLPDTKTLLQNAKPEPGEVSFLELELKLIADLGLVGFPNAGKSSLLRAMSRATPEVAPYPFTTLHPLVGCIEYRDGFRVRAADIPGLIDGASEGRGKGFDFLRHIERTKALLYIVDAAGVDFRDPVEDLHILASELQSYGDGALLERRALVVANKIDLLPEEKLQDVLFRMGEAVEDIGIQCEGDVIGISAGVSGDGLPDLSKAIRDVVSLSEADRNLEFETSEQLVDR